MTLIPTQKKAPVEETESPGRNLKRFEEDSRFDLVVENCERFEDSGGFFAAGEALEESLGLFVLQKVGLSRLRGCFDCLAGFEYG